MTGRAESAEPLPVPSEPIEAHTTSESVTGEPDTEEADDTGSDAPGEEHGDRFAEGDGGDAADPTRAVRAWFRDRVGCDPQCAASDRGLEGTSFFLGDFTRLSSTRLADGFAQLWMVEWATDGPPSGSDLVLVVPHGEAGELADEPDADDVYGLSDLLPAVVAGHRLIFAGELSFNEQGSGDDVVVDRSTIRRPAALRVENGVLRTTFVTREMSTYIVSWEDCQEVEQGPRAHYHRQLLCARTSDAATPAACPACLDAGPGLRCRNVISRRGLARPGGPEDCNGPTGDPRRPSADERRPMGVEVEATGPATLRVVSNRGDVAEALLGERPLSEWPGLPRYESLCPILSLPIDCDDEQRARYHREVGLPAP